MNIAHSFRRAAALRPEKVAVRCGDEELSYADLADQVARFAGYLTQHGIAPGDRVGVLMRNQVEYLVAILASWQVGACAVPYNYLFNPGALRHACEDSGARVILTTAADTGRLAAAVAGMHPVPLIVSDGAAPEAAATWDDLIASSTPHSTVAGRLDGEDAVLMYTSGSTGKPKGVRQTHRNIAAQAEALIDLWGLRDADHTLVHTPLFHVSGLQLLSLPTLMAGGTMTLCRWEVKQFLRDANNLGITFTALAPAMVVDIVNELRGRTELLHSIRVCPIGGSAIPGERLTQFTKATGVVPVPIYGQTEQSGVAITQPTSEEPREGSLGKPLDQIVEVRVVVPDSSPPRDAAVNEVGELWTRGDAVTPGYWQLPQVDSASFIDGWLRTRDLVSADEDGYLYYVERTDDMIISGAENVYPQMVERYLARCPLIADVAVIGTPHERLVQQVTAIVVPSQPDVTQADIAAYCATDADLVGLQRPRRIEILTEMPRTASNKVDRAGLKAMFNKG